jgi:transcriptional regulator with XRE-family HTH domain
MDLRACLRDEFERRRTRNSRYSLRAFARRLGVHHTTIARILGGRHRLTARRIAALGARLGLSAREIGAAHLHEHQRLVASLVESADFRADSRWLATRSGLAVDAVNVALQSLLRERRVVMTPTAWVVERTA